jgi:hemoglobin/transferrin/lactoferrin receptor protein
VTAYYTRLDNAIVRRDFTFNGSAVMIYQGNECRVQALQNAAVARVWGVQGTVDAKFAKHFYSLARVGWQRGREELDNGETSPSRHAAPLFGKVAFGFDNGSFCAEAFIQFQAECSAGDMPEEEKEKTEFYALDVAGNAYSPAWITFNLRASYRFSKRLLLNATFENIADRRYRPYSCGISAPGRNVTMSVTYTL